MHNQRAGRPKRSPLRAAGKSLFFIVLITRCHGTARGTGDLRDAVLLPLRRCACAITVKALLAQPDEIGALIAPAPYRPLSPE
jgi:hypothetical protein